MGIIQWNQVDSSNGQATKSQVIKFVNARACPITILPSSELYAYREVYDPDLGRSRAPQDGEQSRRRYAVPALVHADEQTHKNVLICGQQVVEEIRKIIETTQAANSDGWPIVEVSSSGQGLATRYSAKLLKTIPVEKANKMSSDLPPATQAVEQLLGEVDNNYNVEDNKEKNNNEVPAEANPDDAFDF